MTEFKYRLESQEVTDFMLSLVKVNQTGQDSPYHHYKCYDGGRVFTNYLPTLESLHYLRDNNFKLDQYYKNLFTDDFFGIIEGQLVTQSYIKENPENRLIRIFIPYQEIFSSESEKANSNHFNLLLIDIDSDQVGQRKVGISLLDPYGKNTNDRLESLMEQLYKYNIIQKFNEIGAIIYNSQDTWPKLQNAEDSNSCGFIVAKMVEILSDEKYFLYPKDMVLEFLNNEKSYAINDRQLREEYVNQKEQNNSYLGLTAREDVRTLVTRHNMGQSNQFYFFTAGFLSGLGTHLAANILDLDKEVNLALTTIATIAALSLYYINNMQDNEKRWDLAVRVEDNERDERNFLNR